MAKEKKIDKAAEFRKVLSKKTIKAWHEAGCDMIDYSSRGCITINGWYRINLTETDDKVLKLLTGGPVRTQFVPNIYIGAAQLEALRLTMQDVAKYRAEHYLDDGRIYLPMKHRNIKWELGEFIYYPQTEVLHVDEVNRIYYDKNAGDLTKQIQDSLNKAAERHKNLLLPTQLERWDVMIKHLEKMNKEGIIDKIDVPEMRGSDATGL